MSFCQMSYSTPRGNVDGGSWYYLEGGRERAEDEIYIYCATKISIIKTNIVVRCNMVLNPLKIYW